MLRLSLTLLYTQWVYLSSVFSLINPVSIKPTGHLTLYISADRMIPSHKIALLCALDFVGHVYVSLKHGLHFCQFRIDRSTLLLFLCHYASPSFLIPIIPTKELHDENTAIISSSQKRSRIAALYTKNPPRNPPKWEDSSAVFVYRVWVFSVVSFSSAKNRSTFFCARTNSCISFRTLR